MDLKKLLFELVSINSTNLDYSNNSVGEEEIGDYLYEHFKKNNIDCIKQNVTGNRNNILASTEVDKNKDTILLCSHLDTINMAGVNFNPKIINGKIYGIGSCDAKASVASMVNAFINIKKNNKKITNLFFAGLIGEEYMHKGVKKFIKEFKDFDSAIIGEPTNLNIGIGHKGYIRFRIKTIGRSGHGSNPKLGINAIYNMAKLINRIRTKLELKYNKIQHEVIGNPTINIGKITGGIDYNIIPDNCVIEIDRRTIPREKYDNVLNDFKILIKEIESEENDFHAKINGPIESAPYLETNNDEKIVKIAYKICKKINKTSEINGLSYTTDGGFLAKAGIPTIVLGPGNISNCHKLGEYISLNQVNLASEIYKDIILNYFD